MTNGWVDIKNTDVILAMGGNPAENHPVGFKWFLEARKTRGAKIVAVDPRFTRTGALADLYAPVRAGIGHRLPPRNHPVRDRDEALPRGLRQAPHQRPLHHRREVRLQRRPLLRVRRGQGGLRQEQLGLRGRRQDEGVRGGPDAPEPALRLPAPEGARGPLHARDGRADLRDAEGQVPEGLRDRDFDRQRRTGGHDHLRARLDAALDGRPDDPRRGDAPAPARQRRAGRAAESTPSAATPTSRARPTRPGRSTSCPGT